MGVYWLLWRSGPHHTNVTQVNVYKFIGFFPWRCKRKQCQLKCWITSCHFRGLSDGSTLAENPQIPRRTSRNSPTSPRNNFEIKLTFSSRASPAYLHLLLIENLICFKAIGQEHVYGLRLTDIFFCKLLLLWDEKPLYHLNPTPPSLTLPSLHTLSRPKITHVCSG